MPKTNEALRSFFGQGEREQTVFTPEHILRVPRALWGQIAFDPCPGPTDGTIVHTAKGRKAVKDGHVPELDWVERGLSNHATRQVGALRVCEGDGLEAEWPDHTFVNSPYDVLKLWLKKSLATDTEHMMLVPVRPNRKWWRAWAREATVVYLDPFRFEGHDCVFPAPLCLALRNGDPHPFASLCKRLAIGEVL